VTAFVRNRVSTGQEFYQLDDPTKIKEALLKCEKKSQSFTPTQNLVLIFYEKGRYKIFEVPFEIRYKHFFCKYGISQELKDLLNKIPDPPIYSTS
jgi:hypothetical protein